MKRGLILINAYSKLEHSLNQSKRLKIELEKSGISVDIKRNDFFAAVITDSGEIQANIKDYDFCIYLDKDKYISSMLEKAGLRLFNCHDSIQACDDKMTTAICLADNGIFMPETLPGLLCYDEKEPLKEEFLENVENRLGYPLIVKTSYGSLGTGVFKVDNREELRLRAQKLKCVPHLFQRYIKESAGKDIRIIMIGGKFIAAMERRSEKDFRSNLELGGSGTPIIPSDEMIACCKKITQLLKLDYCGIDVLLGDDKFYICEVNSNAFFGGIERVTGQNVAKAYADHIMNVIYRR